MDSSDIDAAIVAALRADTALAALMPDGVWFETANGSIATGKNVTRFVLVALFDSNDVAEFQRRAYEDALYLVQAVALAAPGAPAGDVKAAAARIEAVLEDQPLTVAGYTWMTAHRERRHRVQEVDPADPAIKWNHRGAFYRVLMSGG